MRLCTESQQLAHGDTQSMDFIKHSAASSGVKRLNWIAFHFDKNFLLDCMKLE